MLNLLWLTRPLTWALRTAAWALLLLGLLLGMAWAIYSKYKERGLVVLGFPSNDFAQETGSSQQIADFCESTFGVKFPMFTKTAVTGEAAAPLFKQLASDSGQKPRWNFYKYLIGRDGKFVESFSSMTGPESRSITLAIEKSLAVKAP